MENEVLNISISSKLKIVQLGNKSRSHLKLDILAAMSQNCTFFSFFTNILIISVSAVPNFSTHYLAGIFVDDTLYFLREHSFPIAFPTLYPLQEFVA